MKKRTLIRMTRPHPFTRMLGIIKNLFRQVLESVLEFMSGHKPFNSVVRKYTRVETEPMKSMKDIYQMGSVRTRPLTFDLSGIIDRTERVSTSWYTIFDRGRYFKHVEVDNLYSMRCKIRVTRIKVWFDGEEKDVFGNDRIFVLTEPGKRTAKVKLNRMNEFQISLRLKGIPGQNDFGQLEKEVKEYLNENIAKLYREVFSCVVIQDSEVLLPLYKGCF